MITVKNEVFSRVNKPFVEDASWGCSKGMNKYLARENSKTTYGLYQGALAACPASQLY